MKSWSGKTCELLKVKLFHPYISLGTLRPINWAKHSSLKSCKTDQPMAGLTTGLLHSLIPMSNRSLKTPAGSISMSTLASARLVRRRKLAGRRGSMKTVKFCLGINLFPKCQPRWSTIQTRLRCSEWCLPHSMGSQSNTTQSTRKTLRRSTPCWVSQPRGERKTWVLGNKGVAAASRLGWTTWQGNTSQSIY